MKFAKDGGPERNRTRYGAIAYSSSSFEILGEYEYQEAIPHHLR